MYIHGQYARSAYMKSKGINIYMTFTIMLCKRTSEFLANDTTYCSAASNNLSSL